MPTKNPRLHVVLERSLFDRVKTLARRNGLSMSLEARDLIREALFSPGARVFKPYTGAHFKKLIGCHRGGAYQRHDDVLAGQVHG
jgi:hypothetical protein